MPGRKKPYGTGEFARELTDRGYPISQSTVIRLFDAGKLEGFTTDSGQRRIFARELERFLQETTGEKG
jgi:hypothetical protein